MKTYAIQLPHNCLPETGGLKHRSWSVESPVRPLLIFLAAALPATAIAVAAVFAFGSNDTGLAAAGLWATGFVFLALGVDSNGPRALLLSASAILLMLFAWMSKEFAVEFGVLGGLIVAAWIAGSIAENLIRSSDNTDQPYKTTSHD